MRRVLLVRCAAPILLLMLGGCLLGPDYARPKYDMPNAFRFAPAELNDVANTAWWEQFQDPVLDQLIATALLNNLDVKVAAARVDEFMGLYISTRSALFPQVSAAFSAERERVSTRSGVPLRSGLSPVFNQFQADVSGIWTIDFFGLIRRQTQAARANLQASEEARRATILTLVASVAASYINLRSLDRQLQIAKATTASRADSVKIFTLRFHGGEVSEMELAQSQSQYQVALATIPQIEAQIAQQEDALSVLLGTNPGPIVRGRELDALSLPEVPAGPPSDLLERRPDLLQAEQNLIAQNALIGAARALYFPSISLAGVFGSISSQFSNLFTGPTRLWSYAGSVTQPIFTGGNITGQVHQAEARQQEALFAYEKAIQVALQQVADAEILLQKSREQLSAQRDEVEALGRYARLARLRFEGGYTSYIEVLDAERSLFDAQLSYTQTEGTTLSSIVSLYLAMGGGWVVKAEGMTRPSSDGAKASPTNEPVAQVTK
jgi:outer membrane protein, multidrug efflux system